jgi:hypothetical protein
MLIKIWQISIELLQVEEVMGVFGLYEKFILFEPHLYYKSQNW